MAQITALERLKQRPGIIYPMTRLMLLNRLDSCIAGWIMVVIDKRTLVDSVTIAKPTGKKDGWGKDEFSYPILLSPVRFDRNFDGPGSVNNPSGQKNPSFVRLVLSSYILAIATLSLIRHFAIRL